MTPESLEPLKMTKQPDNNVDQKSINNLFIKSVTNGKLEWPLNTGGTEIIWWIVLL